MAVTAIEEHEEPTGSRLRFTKPDNVVPFEKGETAPDKPANPEKPVKQVVQVQFPSEELFAVLSLLLKVLAARVILLLAGVGAFTLTLIALNHNTIQGIITSALYDVLVFGPSLFLALRRN